MPGRNPAGKVTANAGKGTCWKPYGLSGDAVKAFGPVSRQAVGAYFSVRILPFQETWRAGYRSQVSIDKRRAGSSLPYGSAWRPYESCGWRLGGDGASAARGSRQADPGHRLAGRPHLRARRVSLPPTSTKSIHPNQRSRVSQNQSLGRSFRSVLTVAIGSPCPSCLAPGPTAPAISPVARRSPTAPNGSLRPRLRSAAP